MYSCWHDLSAASRLSRAEHGCVSDMEGSKMWSIRLSIGLGASPCGGGPRSTLGTVPGRTDQIVDKQCHHTRDIYPRQVRSVTSRTRSAAEEVSASSDRRRRPSVHFASAILIRRASRHWADRAAACMLDICVYARGSASEMPNVHPIPNTPRTRAGVAKSAGCRVASEDGPWLPRVGEGFGRPPSLPPPPPLLSPPPQDVSALARDTSLRARPNEQLRPTRPSTQQSSPGLAVWGMLLPPLISAIVRLTCAQLCCRRHAPLCALRTRRPARPTTCVYSTYPPGCPPRGLVCIHPLPCSLQARARQIPKTS